MPLKPIALLAIAAGACLLAGCGQTGALYLPDAGVTTPVEIRPAPTTAPATTPAAEPADAVPAPPPPAQQQDDSQAEAKPPSAE
jgi:predicted small lipoprotein YifL